MMCYYLNVHFLGQRVKLKESQIASVFRLSEGGMWRGLFKISFLRRVRIVRIFVKVVCLSACSNALLLGGFPRNLMLGKLMKICQNIEIWLKTGKIIGYLTRRPKHLLMLSATFNRHEITLFDRNGIRLLGLPKKYKHYANAPQC